MILSNDRIESDNQFPCQHGILSETRLEKKKKKNWQPKNY